MAALRRQRRAQITARLLHAGQQLEGILSQHFQPRAGGPFDGKTGFGQGKVKLPLRKQDLAEIDCRAELVLQIAAVARGGFG